jgi:alcohol dehydrogenase
MKAVYYEQFCQDITIRELPDPIPTDDGVVVRVKATGLCMSDWHGWMGHDPDIVLPHVPGHELAGVIESVGRSVGKWRVGDRVTLPFVCGCGTCQQCVSGNQQVCDHQFQPGFTHWGSFAEYVVIQRADLNLVRLPDDLDFVTAASLGCRFATSFRAVVDQGNVSAGQWVAVYGCGGVGLSAIMIAKALGACVVAIDISDQKLELARSLGAQAIVNAADVKNVVQYVIGITGGGAHVSLDAVGSPETCFNSISGLRKQGTHIQVGLLLADQRYPPIPMDQVVGKELQILGSHGIQAYRYTDMLRMIQSGILKPHKLIGKTIPLDQVPQELVIMEKFGALGVTVVNQFS